MSKKSVALEKKGIEFCNKILYPKMGWKIIERIHDKARQGIMGDVILRIDNKNYNMDEKTSSYCHSNMVVEYIQDFRTQNMGWLYKLNKCDGLVYMYFKGDIVQRAYKVRFKTLREHIFKVSETWKESKRRGGNLSAFLDITNKEYGSTHNLCYPWDWLIEAKIAKVIYDIKDEYDDVPFKKVDVFTNKTI